MPEAKQDTRPLDLYDRPSTIDGWLAPHYPPQMKITVIETDEGEVMKILALKR